MVQKLNSLVESASQTAGPYVHIGCMPSYAGNAGAYDCEIGESPIAEGSLANPARIPMSAAFAALRSIPIAGNSPCGP